MVRSAREVQDGAREAEALGQIDALVANSASVDDMSDMVTMWGEVGDQAREAEALVGLGGVQAGTSGLEAYTRAAGLWRAIGDGTHEAEALIALGGRQDDFGQAVDGCRRALGLAREAGDWRLQHRAGYGAATALISLHRFQEAVETYDQVVPAPRTEPAKIPGRGGPR